MEAPSPCSHVGRGDLAGERAIGSQFRRRRVIELFRKRQRSLPAPVQTGVGGGVSISRRMGCGGSQPLFIINVHAYLLYFDIVLQRAFLKAFFSCAPTRALGTAMTPPARALLLDIPTKNDISGIQWRVNTCQWLTLSSAELCSKSCLVE